MSGIEVIDRDLSKNPRCPHGPTILFSRVIDMKRRNFFACSACRDRKDCNFFLWENELDKVEETKRTVWEQDNERFLSNFNPKQLEKTLKKVWECSQLNRFYCNTCECFVLEQSNHKNHSITKDITDRDLQYPSRFLSPADKAKKEAQFLFSSTAIQTIVSIIKELGVKNVVCIGAPRIHEYLINNEENTKTILLDIDKRYANFYDCKQFCLYNMFNNHFFVPSSRTIFEDFLRNSKEDILLITDPPFGGRIEPLAKTIRSIWNLYSTLLYKGKHKIDKDRSTFPVFFIFPYFMEPQIKNHLQEFNMCDYKVDYDNHPLFKDGPKGRKYGSPVRIFTNVDLREIKLPQDEGYKYCNLCNMWTANENQHCDKCGVCTSKDGRTYVHCDQCRKCVKPTWRHCNECKKCALIEHECGKIEFSQKCFHCKEEGHKKIDCPNLSTRSKKSKRKANGTQCKAKKYKFSK